MIGCFFFAAISCIQTFVEKSGSSALIDSEKLVANKCVSSVCLPST